MVHLFIPGRHHLLTNFQFNNLDALLHANLSQVLDVTGKPLGVNDSIESLIFGVTSANHSNTKRNPFTLLERAQAIAEFANTLSVPAYIYGINDIAKTDADDFARYSLMTIEQSSDGKFSLNPENTLVYCSTPVLEGYEKKGFKVLPAELLQRAVMPDTMASKYEYVYDPFNPLAWTVLESIAKHQGDLNNCPDFVRHAHISSKNLIRKYDLAKRLQLLFSDPIIGNDGDLTEQRDYRAYVMQMDDIAELKFEDTKPYIKPGRIGDIGCAVGSWIKYAAKDPNYRESDFFGIEISRVLHDICEQRKANGEFDSEYVFFHRRNAVSGLVFPKNSMTTIHTSSLTHEIESYAGHKALEDFIKNRFAELSLEGVWINRDVVGPENGDQIVYLQLNTLDGNNTCSLEEFSDKHSFKTHLETLSTFGKFKRFAHDFRSKQGYQLPYTIEDSLANDDSTYVTLSLRDAMEFASKKDYTDNWSSEMNERFCFNSFSDWKNALEKEGFTIDKASHAFTNQWIVENRLQGKLQLYTMENQKLIPMPIPDTHMLMVAYK